MMLRSRWAAVALAALAPLSSTAAAADPVALVTSFVEACNAHDLDRMLQSCAEDVLWMSVSADRVVTEASGAAQLRASMERYFRQFPTSRSTLRTIAASGSFVTTIEEARWEAAGGPRSQCSAGIYQIDGGRIKNVWYFPAHACDAAAAEAPVLPALPAELDRVLRDYERAWQSRDAAALAALFAEDGYVLSNRKPPVLGREAIRKAYAGAGGPLSLRALSYAVEGSLGYIIGVYAPDADAPPAGKFVLALRRAGSGPWLIAADIDNSIQPPEGPSGAPPP